MNTPTPRTDAVWGKSFSPETPGFCVFDECKKLERELAALTAERDQLRAEVKSCGELSCDECNARTAALMVERDQLRLDCDNETKWAAHYLAQSIADKARAERAEAELAKAKERLRSEAMDDYAAIKDLQRELATERARLDWLESDEGVDWQWNLSHLLIVRRAAIDSAMKEDAK